MIESKFPHLCEELRCINRAYGFVGVLDALLYIQQHEDEYAGTACGREFDACCRMLRPLLAPVEHAA